MADLYEVGTIPDEARVSALREDVQDELEFGNANGGFTGNIPCTASILAFMRVCLRLRVIRCPPSFLRPLPVLPEGVALTPSLQLITIHLVLLYEEQV